jgi:hypothetical protein
MQKNSTRSILVGYPKAYHRWRCGVVEIRRNRDAVALDHCLFAFRVGRGLRFSQSLFQLLCSWCPAPGCLIVGVRCFWWADAITNWFSASDTTVLAGRYMWIAHFFSLPFSRANRSISYPASSSKSRSCPLSSPKPRLIAAISHRFATSFIGGWASCLCGRMDMM